MKSRDATKVPARGPDLAATSEALPRRSGPLAVESSVLQPPSSASDLPNRYDIRERDGVQVLVCREAPGLTLHLDRRFSFSEAEARKLPERSILLDGAGAFSPLIDDAAHLYNLDHHESCLRAFTLATCEQALILVHKGLELDKGDWTVYANEPDLDTVFAIWVLLNYRRLREFGAETRDRIVPLLRLEGAIDANGYELAELCGLPQEALQVEKERLDALHRKELEAKKTGAWAESEPLHYTREMLREVDELVYQGSDFRDYAFVEEEYGHVEIGTERVAVVCRDQSGIYEVEKRLKKVWGERLGIIALEKESNQFTLRRAAALSGIDLAEAYDKLNLLDPAVDGKPPAKRWGGSDDIGGSPRPTGTGLTPREIGKILKLTYKKVRPAQQLQRLATSVLWVLVLGLAAGIAVVSLRFFVASEGGPAPTLEMLVAALTAALGAWLLTRQLSRGWVWLYGWRLPAGRDWWPLIPVAIAGVALVTTWMPRELPQERSELALALAAVLLTGAALELVMRGLVHGLLILDHRVQAVGGGWFLSLPNLAAAVLYAAACTAALTWWTAPLATPEAVESFSWAVVAAGAFAVGLVLGAIRERSLSLWPAVAAVCVGSLCRLAFVLMG
ncbi:MAG: hypothetical protein AAF725_06605 [Acidobacteriota bacterium]